MADAPIPHIEQVRRQGIEAYTTFYEALSDEKAEVYWPASGARDRILALARQLPRPHPDLPLRILVNIGDQLRVGGGSFFEFSPSAPASQNLDQPPPSMPLVRWYSEAMEPYRHLYPDIDFIGADVWSGWQPPPYEEPWSAGRYTWQELLSAAKGIAERGMPFVEYFALSLFVRDSTRDLWPLLGEYDSDAIDSAFESLSLDRKPWAASKMAQQSTADGDDEIFDIVSLQARHAELAAGVPESAWTIFATFLDVHPMEVQRLFGTNIDELTPERIVDRIRSEMAAHPGWDGGNEGWGRPDARATYDYWTADDTLGYRPFADAIASFIRHKETKPPLTIGIRAPWGAGKTSLMRMVQEELDPPQERTTWKPKPIVLGEGDMAKLALLDIAGGKGTVLHRGLGKLWSRIAGTASEFEVTLGHLLDRTQRPLLEDSKIDEVLQGMQPHAETEPSGDKPWRPTVWFNPWMYQNGEQTWAGLSHEIITQISDRLSPVDREWFWLQLNLRRMDREKVRRRVYSVILQSILPAVLTAGVILLLGSIALVAGLVLNASDWLKGLAAVLMSASPVSLAIWGGIRATAGMHTRVAAVFPDLVNGPRAGEQVGDMVRGEAKGALDMVDDPGYKAKAGFLYLVQTDMKRVLDLVATPSQPIVVFVDDLDRCSPETVAMVIEAINLFLAGEFPNCVFILALEPDVVAAHIEVANEKLVTKLNSGFLAEEWVTLGWRFLDKIVQLPLSLPSPQSDEALSRFLDAVLGGPAVGRDSVRAPASPLAVAGEVPASGGPGSTLRPSGGVANGGVAAGAPRAATASAPRAPEPQIDEVLVKDLVARMLRSGVEPSIRAIRSSALQVEAEARSQSITGTLSREALIAARQVFEGALSERNPVVRAAIEDGVTLLGQRNPRQIKRFINLFRFYAFIEAMRSFGAEQDDEAADLSEISKLAAMAIRWPSLISILARRQTLSQLEDAMGPMEAPSELEQAAWVDALVEARLLPLSATLDGDKKRLPGIPPAAERFDELRYLLQCGDSISALAGRLL